MSGRNLEGLKTQVSECIETAYDKGYKSGINDGNINDGTFAAKVKEAYNNGLNDAWECVGKMQRLLYSDIFSDVFGNTDFYTVVTKMTASEAMTKLKEYEEIHIGDEIISDGKKYIVINISKYGGNVVIVDETDALVTPAESVKKTGRRYPVVEMLKGLKNDG
jgi:hypothetical protein